MGIAPLAGTVVIPVPPLEIGSVPRMSATGMVATVETAPDPEDPAVFMYPTANAESAISAESPATGTVVK